MPNIQHKKRPHKRRASVKAKSPHLYARIGIVCVLFAVLAALSTFSVYALIPDQVRNNLSGFEARKDHDDSFADTAQGKQRGEVLGSQSVSSAVSDLRQTSDFSGWSTGLASAYSLETNDDWDETASGIPLNNYSYTVAVPIEEAALLGSSIEIGYGTLSLEALITDTGGLGPLGRDFDLSPAIWHAFGADSESDWGVRTIYYRFVE